jgi:hypothetical protein
LGSLRIHALLSNGSGQKPSWNHCGLHSCKGKLKHLGMPSASIPSILSYANAQNPGSARMHQKKWKKRLIGRPHLVSQKCAIFCSESRR